MKKKLQKVFAILLAISLLTSLMSVTAFANEELVPEEEAPVEHPVIISGKQIADEGGENSDSHVKVSKTIEGTEYENVFDITLMVETETDIKEVYRQAASTAVVIVMDISHTMKEKFGDTNRYEAAMDAAESFINQYATFENVEGADRKLGFVAFNTHAYEVFGLSDCTAETKGALVSTMESVTGAKIGRYDFCQDKDGYCGTPSNCDYFVETDGNGTHTRFTNIEAGLKRANDMLSSATQENKYIIFLSDGFPTTYIESDYEGYDPYDAAGARFKNRKTGAECDYGTSYSDEAALRAQSVARTIKSSGTEIFSVGVDVGGQQLAAYEENEVEKSFSVIDCYVNNNDIDTPEDNAHDYVIGYEEDAFKTWLRTKIGSGRYEDSTNSDQLTAAFDSIFGQIKTSVETAANASWVASDPMSASSPSKIDFLQFYDMNGTLVKGNLAGSWAEGAEDTASFAGDKISWDMKNSGFTKVVSGDETTYTYNLKYRVRLANEEKTFKEDKSVKTNGTTTLNYQITESIDGSTTRLENKDIDFPIPEVKGYLGEFLFRKVDSKTGDPIKNTEFTLTHNRDCTVCNLEGASPDFSPFVEKSGSDGIVKFTKIPSGHTYTLQETQANDGYAANLDAKYTVVVDFDKTTVGGRAVITNETDLFKTVTETPAEGDPVETTVAKEAADFVDGEGNPVATFFEVENTPKATLTITKAVEGHADPDAAFETGYFKFEVKNTEGTYSNEIALPLSDGSWSVTLDKLPDGTYSVKETGTEDYNNGFLANGYTWTGVVYNGEEIMTPIDLQAGDEGTVTVTNTYTYTPDNETIKVVKKWDDDSNRDGIRPDGVIFQLVAGGQVVGIPSELVIYTDGSKNSFDGGFSYNPRLGIPKVQEIGYVIIDEAGVEEKFYDEIPGYTADTELDTKTPSNAVPTIKNTHVPEKVAVNVEKQWDESALGKECAISVILKANGKEINRAEIAPRVVETTTPPAEEGGEPVITTETFWDPVTFTTDKNGDPLYKNADGKEIVYTVAELINGQEIKEDANRGWVAEYYDTEADWEVPDGEGSVFDWVKDMTITNSYISSGGGSTTTSVKVSKVWDDDNDAAGLRPESITVQLLKDGKVYDEVTLNESTKWKKTWGNLTKTAEWTVVEVNVPEGYSSVVESVENKENQFVITNTYTTTEIEEEEPPLADLPEEEPPLAELPEEEVPLAVLPATGDASALWMVLSALSGAGLFVTRKKRDEE